jgi:hypothetical protein
VLVATPGGAVADAFDAVTGWDGKTVIDADQRHGRRAAERGFSSNAEFIKSKTNGPTAKSFNLNFAALYDQIDGGSEAVQHLERRRGGRDVVEQLIRDAGYDPSTPARSRTRDAGGRRSAVPRMAQANGRSSTGFAPRTSSSGGSGGGR